MSTPGAYRSVQGGCSVHRRDTMSTPEGHHEYTRGNHEYTESLPSVHGGVFSIPEGYHEYTEGLIR